MTLPSFPLFPDPGREHVFASDGAACSLCGQARGYVYDGPRYGEADDDVTVCPWCIADGTAGARGITFNDATLYGDGGDDDPPQMSDADAALVEQRTPGFTTWQGNRWRMCCGRACIYLGEADAAALRGPWREAVPSMFAGEGRSADEIDAIVASMSRGGSPTAYVFRCQICRRLSGYWDCD